jgi:hypothetical protein
VHHPRFLIALGGLTLAALGALLPLVNNPANNTVKSAMPEAFASGALRANGPTVALLATRPGALHTSLYLAPAGASETSAPVATFTHLAGAVVRGSVIPGTSIVLATADTKPTRDLSFNASLFRVAPHEPPEALCDGVVHASRPLVTASGRVFISRGSPGVEEAGATTMRVDDLSIEEVDPATGALRPIHTMSGYLAFLAGSIGSEVLLYRVSPGGADIVAVDADSGAVRPILPSLPPFARDFSVDEGSRALVFQGRHETDSRTWVIDRVDLTSGKKTRLYEGGSLTLAPHAWPGGAVVFNPDGSGLKLLGAGEGAPALQGPLGEGVDVVLAASQDKRWLAALHTVPGALPAAFAVSTETGAALALHGPPGARIAVAGFVAGGAL